MWFSCTTGATGGISQLMAPDQSDAQSPEQDVRDARESRISKTREEPQTSALELTNERLRLALASSRTSTWDWDIKSGRDHRFGDLKTIFGIDADFYDAPIEELQRSIHPHDRDAANKAMVRARDRREPYAAEFRIIWPNGTVKWLRTTGKFFYSADGQPERMLGMAADITEAKGAEHAKRETDEQYRRIVETAEEGITVADANFCITFVNRQMAEMTGYAPEELIGRRLLDLQFPENIEEKKRKFQSRRSGAHGRYADRLRRKDGSDLWVRISATPILRENGQFDGALAMISDIGEEKRTEYALRQSERELLEAQRMAKVGSWQWDPDTDNVWWSEESYRIAGRDPRLPAVNFKDQRQLYVPESWQRLQRAVEDAVGDGTPYDLELEVIRPNATTGWIRARGEAQRDATGRIKGLRGTTQDITERKRAEEALRESEERLRFAARAGRMFAYEWDLTTDAIVRSEECAEILGLTGDVAHTTREALLATIHPEDRDQILAAISELRPEKTVHRASARVVRPDGVVVWLEWTGRGFFDAQGKVVRLIGMAADVTERKLAEEALSSVGGRLIEAQDEERRRIARELHDDVSQKLVMLESGLQELAGMATESPIQLRTRIESLLKSTSEMSEDVHGLSHRLHTSKLELLGLVPTMRGFCREFAGQRNVEIDFVDSDVPNELPPQISLTLFRILQEGLSNAVRHSGVRRFEGRLERVADQLLLTIRDSGVGFDPPMAMHNQGLGLISMRERVNLVKGTLSIVSKPGGGTQIVVRVPLAAQSGAEQKSASA